MRLTALAPAAPFEPDFARACQQRADAAGERGEQHHDRDDDQRRRRRRLRSTAPPCSATTSAQRVEVAAVVRCASSSERRRWSRRAPSRARAQQLDVRRARSTASARPPAGSPDSWVRPCSSTSRVTRRRRAVGDEARLDRPASAAQGRSLRRRDLGRVRAPSTSCAEVVVAVGHRDEEDLVGARGERDAALEHRVEEGR